MVIQGKTEINGLRWQWLVVAAVYAIALLAGYILIGQVWPPHAARTWLTITAAAMAVQLAILWWALPSNHPNGAQTPFRTLGYANALTLGRGLLTSLMAGFFFGPAPLGWLAWVPALLYALERLVDFGDGYVARVTGRETRLGEILDIEYDGLGILVAVGLAIQYGKLPPWYLLLGLGRPLFVAGMWLRHRRGLPVYDLPPSDQRRVIAGFQTGFVALTLWPLLSPTVTQLSSYFFAVPLIFSFGRDWLVVSGVLDPASPSYQRVRRQGKLLVEGWLPLVARIAGAALAALLLAQAMPAGVASLLPGLPALLTFGMVALWMAAAAAMLLGAAGRIAAAGLFTLACWQMQAAGLDWTNGMLLACTIFVAHLGSGRLALWRPEERFLHTKLGTPRPHTS